MTKLEATKQGRILLKRMKGPGWKLTVWKNIGWHFKVSNGSISVHQFSPPDKRYFILMTDSKGDSSGGSYLWNVEESFTDPNKAVRTQLKLARSRVEWLHELLTDHERRLISLLI